MKRMLASIVAALLIIASFAAAEPITLPYDRWVLTKPGERYVFNVSPQALVTLSARAEQSCDLMITTPSGEPALNQPIRVRGLPGKPDTAKGGEFLNAGWYEAALARSGDISNSVYIKIQRTHAYARFMEYEPNDRIDLAANFFSINTPISGIAAFNDPADYFRINEVNNTDRYMLHASGLINGFEIDVLDKTGKTLSSALVKLNGRGEIMSSRAVPLLIPAGSSMLRLKNIDACYGPYTLEFKEIPVKKIIIPKKLSLKVGQSRQLKAKIKPQSSSLAFVSWSISPREVATVDQNGVVTAISPGKAILIAEGNNWRADGRCVVMVK